ncbi:MAG: phosphopentomutase, partial [Eubacteriales bacterium]
ISGAVARLCELSNGKDTTIGHWEMAGIISEKPLPTYPNGFPDEVLDKFKKATGRGVLCNLPYSGTQALTDFGEEHLRTGDLIVYTSSDSVFQIAAHESLVSPEQLYEYCRIARKILVGEHAVGRVIARPFEGEVGHFVRTPRRHDFSLEPAESTMLDSLKAEGYDVIGVGKIHDIFAGRGLTEYTYSESNADGLAKTGDIAKRDFRGLCFTNLVDFDSKFGHRRDIDGYAAAISEFDAWLGDFLPEMREDDVIIITADHGCDPSFTKTTDHTREYVPMLIAGARIRSGDLGTLEGFDNVAATVCAMLGSDTVYEAPGVAGIVTKGREPNVAELLVLAEKARRNAYVPYSHFKVGSALLSKSGKVYIGCNVENAAYGSTICAERNAMTTAIAAGEREFSAIAVTGGINDPIEECVPCGSCRQFMSEFSPNGDLLVITGSPRRPNIYTLEMLLPYSFGGGDIN